MILGEKGLEAVGRYFWEVVRLQEGDDSVGGGICV